MVGIVAEIWRYPVKSMGGERVARSRVAQRGLHADRMWAVRDLELDAFTTARRWPVLLECRARFVEDPAQRSADPGDVLDVIVTLPDGHEIASSDPAVHERLSELIGKPARLEALPGLTEKRRYRAPRITQADMRRQFALADDEPLPDFSMLPVRKLAELARYATPVGALYDVYPIHLLTRGSLRAMTASAPGSEFAVRRFRPNVVVELEGAEVVEFGWCGGVLRAPDVSFDVDVPTLRCSIPTRPQRDLPADPQVLRAINAQADHCLGVYVNVSREGLLEEGDALEFELAGAGRREIVTRAGTTALKRRALRAVDALMPRGT